MLTVRNPAVFERGQPTRQPDITTEIQDDLRCLAEEAAVLARLTWSARPTTTEFAKVMALKQLRAARLNVNRAAQKLGLLAPFVQQTFAPIPAQEPHR